MEQCISPLKVSEGFVNTTSLYSNLQFLVPSKVSSETIIEYFERSIGKYIMPILSSLWQQSGFNFAF